jgi:site-specific recombinase XerD
MKRVPHHAITYLEKEEMEAILEAIDLRSPTGLRDRTLLTLLYNTGARVQEIANIDVAHIRFSAPPKVRLMGKGRKMRDCPLWQQTVELLRRTLKERGISEDSKEPLFQNVRGRRLSRHGVAYILQRAVNSAKPQLTSVHPQKITPHVIRHTTAIQLLRAGVDITVIAAWLGHVDLRTTHHYVEIDIRMKHAAVAESAATLPDSVDDKELDSELIDWLDALGKGRRYE